MSVYENLQKRLEEEDAYESALVIDEESKVVSVRPDALIVALVEILAFFENRAPAEFIITNFSEEFARYLIQHKDTIESIKNVIERNGTNTILPSDNCALGKLVKENIIKSDNIKFDFF